MTNSKNNRFAVLTKTMSAANAYFNERVAVSESPEFVKAITEATVIVSDNDTIEIEPGFGEAIAEAVREYAPTVEFEKPVTNRYAPQRNIFDVTAAAFNTDPGIKENYEQRREFMTSAAGILFGLVEKVNPWKPSGLMHTPEAVHALPWASQDYDLSEQNMDKVKSWLKENFEEIAVENYTNIDQARESGYIWQDGEWIRKDGEPMPVYFESLADEENWAAGYYMDNDAPITGAVMAPKDILAKIWLRNNYAALYALGFVIARDPLSDGEIVGIMPPGLGCDFYKHYWAPVYLLYAGGFDMVRVDINERPAVVDPENCKDTYITGLYEGAVISEILDDMHWGRHVDSIVKPEGVVELFEVLQKYTGLPSHYFELKQ